MSSKTILIVDDEEALRETLSDQLAVDGEFAVTQAGTLGDAAGGRRIQPPEQVQSSFDDAVRAAEQMHDAQVRLAAAAELGLVARTAPGAANEEHQCATAAAPCSSISAAPSTAPSVAGGSRRRAGSGRRRPVPAWRRSRSRSWIPPSP